MTSSDWSSTRLKKPGQVLGFVLYGSMILGCAWLLVHFVPSNYEWAAAVQIHQTGRVGFAVGYLAYLAALWSARTAVVNMVRQHTVNTLLQSRLSDVFIERGEAVSAGIALHAKHKSSEAPHVRYVPIASLRYILNFYEYVAVGIKYGDLDEDVMYDTLRSAVMSLCTYFSAYIESEQRTNSRYFCNLIDLRNRWALRKENEEVAAARSACADAARAACTDPPVHEVMRRTLSNLK